MRRITVATFVSLATSGLLAGSAVAAVDQPPVLVTPPVISGFAEQHGVLSTTRGTWANDPTFFAVRWERCDAITLRCAPIADEARPTYAPTASDVGYLIRSVVTAWNDHGSSTAAAGPTAPITAATTAPSPGRHAYRVVVSGLERTWSLLVPQPDPAGARRPLVVILSNDDPTALDRSELSAMSEEFVSEGAIVAYAEPFRDTWTGSPSDISFLNTVIDHAAASGAVDVDRVALVGYLNGGVMAGRFACARADRVASLVMINVGHSADPAFTSQVCQPSRPLPVHVISNVNDPADGTVVFWQAVNGCAGEVHRRIKASPWAVTRYESYGCVAGSALRYDTIAAPQGEWVDELGYVTDQQVWAFVTKFRRLLLSS